MTTRRVDGFGMHLAQAYSVQIPFSNALCHVLSRKQAESIQELKNLDRIFPVIFLSLGKNVFLKQFPDQIV